MKICIFFLIFFFYVQIQFNGPYFVLVYFKSLYIHDLFKKKLGGIVSGGHLVVFFKIKKFKFWNFKKKNIIGISIGWPLNFLPSSKKE